MEHNCFLPQYFQFTTQMTVYLLLHSLHYVAFILHNVIKLDIMLKPTLMYGYETCSMEEKERFVLNIRETENMRKPYGPVTEKVR